MASTLGALIIILIGAEYIYSRTQQAITPAQPVSLVNGEVRIPVAELADRELRRYIVRAGLDACLICGTQGYYQDGASVMCRNCAAAIYVPTVGLADGQLALTPHGERRAREVVRRHRLAERLSFDTFGLEEELLDSSACKIEHTLGPEVTVKICAFLKHPQDLPAWLADPAWGLLRATLEDSETPSAN